MTRALIALCAASLLSLASCRDPERDGFVQLPCSDAGECFDGPLLDVFASATDGMPDAPSADMSTGDAMPNAVDAIPDVMDATSDGTDAIPGAMDAMPGTMDAMPDAMPDAVPDIFEQPDAAHGPDDMAPPGDSGRPPEPVESCAEIDSVECFGHPDCPDAQRCENVGTEQFVVPCCVPGRRGDIEPGGSCADVDGQIECNSGICIEDVAGDDLCSGPCEDASDCPAALPRCVAFPFGGTDFLWCFPE